MIDAHRHFWNYSPSRHAWIDDSMGVLRRDFLPQERVPLAPAHPDEGCIAVQALHLLEETRWLLDASTEVPSVRGVVGFVDLCAPSAAAQLDEFSAHPRFVGVRHLVQDEPRPHFLSRPDFRRGLDEVGQRGLTFDLLVREPQRKEALDLVRDFPALRFVLDHLGKPPVKRRELEPWRAQMVEFARCDNLFCKLSGLATEAGPQWTEQDLAPFIDAALEIFGPRRLVFGSDWPVCLLAGEPERVAAAHLAPLTGLSPSEFRAVTHGNAVHVYGLTP